MSNQLMAALHKQAGWNPISGVNNLLKWRVQNGLREVFAAPAQYGAMLTRPSSMQAMPKQTNSSLHSWSKANIAERLSSKHAIPAGFKPVTGSDKTRRALLEQELLDRFF